MSVLTLAEKPESEQIEAIEKGLPSHSLRQISAMLGLPKQRLIQRLRLAQRTVSQRERQRRPFPAEESERLLRVLRIRRILREVFTTDEAVAEWLDSPERSLAMRTPLSMLTTGIGYAKVENLALAMIHGVPV